VTTLFGHGPSVGNSATLTTPPSGVVSDKLELGKRCKLRLAEIRFYDQYISGTDSAISAYMLERYGIPQS
jgi:hypothetical protein